MELIQVIISIVIITIGAAIMFLASAVYATPKDDPNETIIYLKQRVDLLEIREHMRMLEDREIMMGLMHNTDKKKDTTDKKSAGQTKWVG